MAYQVFRQGESGYSDCEDRTIRLDPPPDSGNHPTIWLGRTSVVGPDLGHILIRFEDLPDTANLQGAIDIRLRLEQFFWSNANDLDIKIYKVLRDWSEGYATWIRYIIGSDWTTPGCNGIGTDREDADLLDFAIGLTAAGPEVGTVDLVFNATGRTLIKTWLGAGSNNGIIIQTQSSTYVNHWRHYRSRDYTVEIADRPGLVFTWSGGEWCCFETGGKVYGKEADWVGLTSPANPSLCWKGEDGLIYGIEHEASPAGDLPQCKWEVPTNVIRGFEATDQLDPVP